MKNNKLNLLVLITLLFSFAEASNEEYYYKCDSIFQLSKMKHWSCLDTSDNNYKILKMTLDSLSYNRIGYLLTGIKFVLNEYGIETKGIKFEAIINVTKKCITKNVLINPPFPEKVNNKIIAKIIYFRTCSTDSNDIQIVLPFKYIF